MYPKKHETAKTKKGPSVQACVSKSPRTVDGLKRALIHIMGKMSVASIMNAMIRVAQSNPRCG